MGYTELSCSTYLLYFSDYKMHFPPQKIWEENGGASYSPNVAYLAHWGGRRWRWSGVTGGRSRTTIFASTCFSYFPPLTPRCVLWSGASHSPKNMVTVGVVSVKSILQLPPMYVILGYKSLSDWHCRQERVTYSARLGLGWYMERHPGGGTKQSRELLRPFTGKKQMKLLGVLTL